MVWTWSCRLSFLSYRLLFVSFFLQPFTDYYFDECIKKLQTAFGLLTVRWDRAIRRGQQIYTNIGNIALKLYFYAFTFTRTHLWHMHDMFNAIEHVFLTSVDIHTSLNCSSLINEIVDFSWADSLFFAHDSSLQPVKCQI